MDYENHCERARERESRIGVSGEESIQNHCTRLQPWPPIILNYPEENASLKGIYLPVQTVLASNCCILQLAKQAKRAAENNTRCSLKWNQYSMGQRQLLMIAFVFL